MKKLNTDEIKKLKTKNKFLLITLTVLVLTLLAIGGYFLTRKVILNKDTGSNNQNETSQTKNGEKVTTLDKDKQPDKITPPTPQKNNIQNIKLDKVKVNTTLKDDPLGFIFLIFTDFYSKDLVYNKNLLDNKLNKFNLLFFSMMADNEYSKKMLEVEIEGPGSMFEVGNNALIEYSKKILVNPFTFETLKEVKGPGIEHTGTTVISSGMAGRGAPLFAIKANKLTYNSDNKIYTLTCDFVAAKNKAPEAIEKVVEPNVLTWNSSLNYAKCIIEYIKDGKQDKIKSIIFTKK